MQNAKNTSWRIKEVWGTSDFKSQTFDFELSIQRLLLSAALFEACHGPQSSCTIHSPAIICPFIPHCHSHRLSAAIPAVFPAVMASWIIIRLEVVRHADLTTVLVLAHQAVLFITHFLSWDIGGQSEDWECSLLKQPSAQYEIEPPARRNS